MADPKHPRHYEEAFKRQIVQLYENGKPAREIRAEYDIARSTPNIPKPSGWIRSPATCTRSGATAMSVTAPGRSKPRLERRGVITSRRRIVDIMKRRGMTSVYARRTFKPHRTRVNEARLANIIDREFDGYEPRTRLAGGLTCLCSISCCGFSHDDFSGLGRACRPRNGLNWMVLVSPPERTGKDYDQHAPSTVYPSFAAERGIRRVDRAENTCQRADGA